MTRLILATLLILGAGAVPVSAADRLQIDGLDVTTGAPGYIAGSPTLSGTTNTRLPLAMARLSDRALDPRSGTRPEAGAGIPVVVPLSAGLVPPLVVLRGTATWYDAPSPLDAAAGPSLRAAIGPRWRGTWVRVSSGGRTILARLTDWCLCTGGHDRLLDLDDMAFARLAPLSQGVVSVVVETGDVVPPATDTAGNGLSNLHSQDGFPPFLLAASLLGFAAGMWKLEGKRP